MTADAAHVAAVAEAVDAATLALKPHGYVLATDERDAIATVAVETLTPLIRAQERAKVAAEILAQQYVASSPESSLSRTEDAWNQGTRNAARIALSDPQATRGAYVGDDPVPAARIAEDGAR